LEAESSKWKSPDGPFFTGHLGKENYVLVGLDVDF
jgi:hypothetical protein